LAFLVAAVLEGFVDFALFAVVGFWDGSCGESHSKCDEEGKYVELHGGV
jgi:hypothetical protein